MSKRLLHYVCPLVIASMSWASPAIGQTEPASKLLFSTYLGGSGFDEGFATATDDAGNLYVAGLTSSNAFPGTTAGLSGTDTAFVAKFAPGGQLVYSTRIGGSGFTEAFGLAVDGAGNLYVTGQTSAVDFPIVNGPQPSYGGGFSDAFVAKFDPSGLLIYSTFLGGASPANEFGRAIAVDRSGNAYVAGTTSALDFPTRNPFQGTYGGGFSDAFVTKLNTNVAGDSGLVYSTFLGSFGFDTANAVAVDASGNAVVGGGAGCCFPTTPDAVRTQFGGGTSHAFAARLGVDGRLLYSTLLGGNEERDVATAIAIDRHGAIVLGGETSAADFMTTPQAAQPVKPAFTTTGFLAVIDPSVPGAAGLTYATFLGGSVFDSVGGVAVDEAGLVTLVGATDSPDFPTKNPIQASIGGQRDGFVVQVDPAAEGAAGLRYATFLGGGNDDEFDGVSLASAARIAIAGFTDGPFPTASPFQPGAGGGRDAVVVYLSLDVTPPALTLPADMSINATSPAGAIGSFVASATDLVDPDPAVQCAPPSGSLFAIGTTQVVCSASDASGNISTPGTFQLHVEGAAEQILDLKAFVVALALNNGLTNSLESKLTSAQTDPLPGACSDLNDFINQVSAKTGTAIPEPAADQLTTAAKRIRTVLGCTRP